MQTFKGAEILAPVGNREMLVAAVRSGADAVYLGAEEFSARRNAQNFSSSALKEAIEYCHIRGVRVYLTLNILIKENELEAAFSLALSAYNMGIDGIIVQDIGLARILHENIPRLPLHASTQLSVHSPSALPVLKRLGFCRVVAAREMSKQELISFCKAAKELDIEVEVFVHGALCMSMSGQCLLSAFLGSRSGNRGLCAGPCRLPFKVKNGTGYDLSLKDLSLLKYIKELCLMGVCSFKIEGRMKRAEYVAAAVSACRNILYEDSPDDTIYNSLKNVFSRSGFTAGYYESSLGREMFGIRTKEDVTSAEKEFPAIHSLYRFERKAVPLELCLKIAFGKPVFLSLFDGKNKVTVTGSIPLPAKTKATDKDSALKSLSKLGDTPYFINKADINIEKGLFVSAGELNLLRRNACEELNLARARPPEQKFAEYKARREIKAGKKIPETVIRVSHEKQIPEVLKGISAVIFPLEESLKRKLSVPLIADIPRGILSETSLYNLLCEFKAMGGKAALCGNIAHIELVKKAGLSPLAGTGLNITNSEALKAFSSFGINAAVISCEEELNDIKNIPSDIKKGIVSYGNIPLMLFRNCPVKNGISCKECNKNGYITDRLGVAFPVNCRLGYSELYNSLPVWLADRREDLLSLDFTVLYFTRESPERVNEVIAAYQNSLACDVKFTRGLYYRGTV